MHLFQFQEGGAALANALQGDEQQRADRSDLDEQPLSTSASRRQSSSARSASRASLSRRTTTASAATGSAHHQPSAALSARPMSTTADSQTHAVVWAASAATARLASAVATWRFRRASTGMTMSDSAVRTRPTVLASGSSRSARAEMDS